MAGAFSAITTQHSFDRESDLLVVYPGQGEHHRLIRPISEWEERTGFKAFLDAGFNTGTEQDSMPDHPYSQADLMASPFNLTRTEGVIYGIHQNITPDQARTVCDHVGTNGWTSVTLATAGYHLPRAWMTTLAEMLKRGMRFALWPAITNLDYQLISPQNRVTEENLIAGEMQRSIDYRTNGNVATVGQVYTHLGWQLSL